MRGWDDVGMYHPQHGTMRPFSLLVDQLLMATKQVWLTSEDLGGRL